MTGVDLSAQPWLTAPETRRVLDALDGVTAERDALKKRVADAPRHMLYPRDEGEKTGWVAHLPLEDGE